MSDWQDEPLPFDRTHTRTTDPNTSRDAAASMEGAAANLKTLILRVFHRYTGLGLTQQDVTDALETVDRQSINKRLSDLQADGEIRPSGETRKSSVTGRAQQVYVLSDGVPPEPKLPKWRRVLLEMQREWQHLDYQDTLAEFERRMNQ